MTAIGYLAIAVMSGATAGCNQDGYTVPTLPYDECVEDRLDDEYQPCGGDCGGPTCGNGIVEGSETCDDGNSTDWDGCTGCRVTEILLNDRVEEDQIEPAIDAFYDGGFVAAWIGDLECASGKGVFVRCFDEDGVPRGPATIIDRMTGEVTRVNVASATDGRFAVAWVVGEGVYMQRFDEACLMSARTVFVGTEEETDKGAPGIRYTPSGDFRLVWREGNWNDTATDPDHCIDSMLVDRDTAEQGVPTSLYCTYDPIRYPKLAVADDGSFAVTWLQYRYDGSQLYIGVFGPDGEAASPPVLVAVSTNFGSPKGGIDLSPAMGGGFLVIYSFPVSESYQARVYGTDGVQVGDEVTIPLPVHSNRWFSGPTIDSTGDGYALTIFDDDLADYDRDVLVASLGPDLSLNSSWLVIHDWGEGEQLLPAVAGLDGGRFIVAWQSQHQDGYGNGVFVQRFRGPGEGLGVQPW